MSRKGVLILGGAGMLGHKLWQACRGRFNTVVTIRGDFAGYERVRLFERESTIEGVDAADFPTVSAAIQKVRPEVVVNCIGIVKQLAEAHNPLVSIPVNSLFPHQLAALCSQQNIRLIHLSTDCVFSGNRGSYTESDLPDPVDLYGRSKLLGEVEDPHLTLRTSMIGRELGRGTGLVEWFLAQPGPSVRGYTRAIFSGFPTIILSEIIARIISEFPRLAGLYHLSADPINKRDILGLLREAYRKPIEVIADDTVRIDRSLVSHRFRQATGFQPAPWPEMIQRMVQDPTPYDAWRSA